MNSKKLLLLTFTFLLVVLVMPAMNQIVAAAQVPPPHLPGAPDQSPLWGGALVILAGTLYAIWRLRKTAK